METVYDMSRHILIYLDMLIKCMSRTKFMSRLGRESMPIVTVDVYVETYKKLVPFAETNRRGMKGLVNEILGEWVSKQGAVKVK